MAGDHSSHAHAGWHGPRRPETRLEVSVWIAVATCAVVTILGVVAFWPRGDATGPDDLIGLSTPASRAVIRVLEIGPCSESDPDPLGCQNLTVEVTSGEYRGQIASMQFANGQGNPSFSQGDKILVDPFLDVNGELLVAFNDFQRSTPMLWLTLLFVVSVLALGRLRGLGALGGLVASLAVLTLFVLPSILRGNDAVSVALVGCGVIAFMALFLAHGVNVATSITLLGTFASLLLIGGLAWFFTRASKLTGLSDEYATVLPALGADVELKGILLAGIVIGSLGVLDDVTVTQVSTVWELREAQPEASSRQLYSGALRVGRDHIASTVNTLFLAYAGAALPLMLLFTQTDQSITSISTREIVATEVIRSMVGSIGLVASVPITTFLAARVLASRAGGVPPLPVTKRRRTAVERSDG